VYEWKRVIKKGPREDLFGVAKLIGVLGRCRDDQVIYEALDWVYSGQKVVVGRGTIPREPTNTEFLRYVILKENYRVYARKTRLHARNRKEYEKYASCDGVIFVTP